MLKRRCQAWLRQNSRILRD